jgi:hypothetical protein
LTGFTSDTITLAPTFNFAKGTYQVKAYFSSVLDDTPLNDTLITIVVINPEMTVQLTKTSAPNACLAGESPVWQEVVITNTGNMDLSDIELVLQIDTGETGSPVYDMITETYQRTIAVDSSVTYRFSNAYTVPWNTPYYVRVTANLPCNLVLANNTTEIEECVDMKDLYMVSIDNPSGTVDNVESSIQARATLHNRSDVSDFQSANINVQVRNSQGVEITSFAETITIGALATVSHTFSQSYIVPNDSVYYLTVYVNHYDNYPNNDTIIVKRYTTNVGILPTEETKFTLGQNIPNPANNSTLINYSVPEAGEVIFHVHSISGQVLYSKTIEVGQGRHTLELNTSTLAAGVYFYSIEYKGQRLVKRMSVK